MKQEQRQRDGQSGVVLIVDDEPRVLDGLCDILRKDRHELLTATSGEAALTLLSQMKVDVVISDERMPNMAGHVLLERTKRAFPDVIRIMLTGQASLEIACKPSTRASIATWTSPCNRKSSGA